MSNNIPMTNGNGGSNGTATETTPTEGFLGGMDVSTVSALVVLASAFIRR